MNLIFDTEFSLCVRFFERQRAAVCSQASFQKNDSASRETSLFLVKCSFPRGRIIFFKSCLGAYRGPFSIEMSNAGPKFSIEDGAYVERSQKSFKVGKKYSFQNWGIVVLKKWPFFLVLRPWPSGEFCFFSFLCTGPSMNPGGVQKENEFSRGTVRRRDGTAGWCVNI